MKQKTKTLIKAGILLLGISLFLVNCQQDDLTTINEINYQNNPKLIVQKISVRELLEKEVLKKPLEKLSNKFHFNKSKSKNPNNNYKIEANDDSFTILTDEVIMVTKDSLKTYSFLIETPTNPYSKFENFVLTQTDENVFNYFIYRYRENDDDEFPYSITIEEIAEDQVDIIEFMDYTTAYIMYDASSDCLYEITNSGCCTIVEVLWCGGGGGGSSSSSGSTGSGSTGTGGTTGSGDSGYGGDSGSGGSGGSGGSSSSGSSSNNNSGTNSVPTPVGVNKPVDNFYEDITGCLDNLTPAQQNWLNDMPTNLAEASQISQIINQYGCSSQTETFAIAIINTMIDNPTDTFDDVVWENANLFPEIIVGSPVITDIVDYLDCFDLTQPAELTLYVDQPKANTADPYRITYNPLDMVDVGHTFIAIKQGGITRVLGYYPIPNTINPSNDPAVNVISCASILRNDSGHEFNVSVTDSISPSQLSTVYNSIINSAPTYNLNTYNCTDFGIEIGNTSDLIVPDNNDTWPRGGNGSNPGNLGQDIRSMTIPASATKNTTGGTSESNAGSC